MIKTGNIIKVGIADANTVLSPDTIRTSGLGSCVGVILYDERSKKAGLVHIMLPDSSLARSGEINPAKFADTGISYLIEMLSIPTSRLKAKLAGGAQMFQFAGQKDTMRIGPRNVEAVKKVLNSYKIKIISEDTGGSSGRTIEFDPASCLLHIRTVNIGEKVI
ncbi:chemotaxis protein CheD [Jeotgalibacillus haloalkalitolerans]|uniref:Probable chemoreceptor glutamine deamidase CheD n=1 Tax=Jeotgalibacillus haloalkalitolerans TaxID=3104292 RepID=A0ABU5KKF1_9BACL|nr:chemotaxis protein CheD [Jeotgalibacillus sp. HH7-29]MDZ5711744.1 chemotaxis protein CheD [Jeotgalibacillus sp. HH7-29]